MEEAKYEELSLKCCQVDKVKKVYFLKVCTLKKYDVKQHIVGYILFLADTLFGPFLLSYLLVVAVSQANPELNSDATSS